LVVVLGLRLQIVTLAALEVLEVVAVQLQAVPEPQGRETQGACIAQIIQAIRPEAVVAVQVL
jgi:hypothetical protein